MTRSGFRLARLEVLNWGTFGDRVWVIEAGGDNTLLTGDIGSGKSTLVDAVTTLLVPPQRLAYNRAAGADARERSLRSYVLGHYKTARGDDGGAARPVKLRGEGSYSVLLARFTNDGFGQTVCLAQVFWLKDLEGQPARMYVVADEALTIAEHFAGFGNDIGKLKKRLRAAKLDVHESFPPYAAAFRRKFGIQNEQALDLFHQTVSMKSVGNLTDFVRQHMLQPFPVEPRIAALIAHFDDLSRAHEAVLRAKSQIARLAPIVQDCDRHDALVLEAETLRACREGLRPWFALTKALLLERRTESLQNELSRLEDVVSTLTETREREQVTRDELARAIAVNGGDRLEAIKAEIKRLFDDVAERQARAKRYDVLAEAVGLPRATDADSFAANRGPITFATAKAESERDIAKNALTELTADLRESRARHDIVEQELVSLRRRKSNIPAQMLLVRDRLCHSLDLTEADLPFAGELLQVRPEESDWEGAAERVLHGFGLSLLVMEPRYAQVARWVDANHVGGRLVYFLVRGSHRDTRAPAHAGSLIRKLSVRGGSPFSSWLESELARRFDFACCESIDEFAREPMALTRAGQTKSGAGRHEKDDRTRIDDRSRYVLGWTNDAKIRTLEGQQSDLQAQIQRISAKIAETQRHEKALTATLSQLGQLAAVDTYREIAWQGLSAKIFDLESEQRSIEAASNVLATLTERLCAVDEVLGRTRKDLDAVIDERGGVRQRHDTAMKQKVDCDVVLDALDPGARARLGELDVLVLPALGDHKLTVESCDGRERAVREQVQASLDGVSHKIARLAEKIVQAMQAFRSDYPNESREMDASVEAAAEYRSVLARLGADDLPRFERRFKELLNENTIREIVAFQSQLARERQDIKERIDTINRSLKDIEYNPGRYISLGVDPSVDADVREFQHDLRACTEGAFTGSEDEAYSEAKFLHVRAIIEKFRGRDGTAEMDARWTRKVTDVRQWFTFSAAERWHQDDKEHEHYTDSGGKSGGQKEKLAYTILAASLAYQFGLEWNTTHSRSFRFVVIDEAFGRGSDESTRYGLELFEKLNLQLRIVTPLQKIRVIEPHIANVAFVHNDEGRKSMVRNLTIEEYRAELVARHG